MGQGTGRCTDYDLVEGGGLVLGDERGIHDSLELRGRDVEDGARVSLEAGHDLLGVELG